MAKSTEITIKIDGDSNLIQKITNNGAVTALNSLKDYIMSHKEEFDTEIMTIDHVLALITGSIDEIQKLNSNLAQNRKKNND